MARGSLSWRWISIYLISFELPGDSLEIDLISEFGFVEYVQSNYEVQYNVFLFTHEAHRKSTERPDLPKRA